METNFNQKKTEKIAEAFFYESSAKSEWLPIDLDFINENRDNLEKVPLEDLIIYNLKKFPEIYNHRILLCLIDDLLKMDKENWLKIINNINEEVPYNILWMFMHVFLRLKPSETLYKKKIHFHALDSMDMDEDDIDFINNYSISGSMDKLRNRLLKFEFVIPAGL